MWQISVKRTVTMNEGEAPPTTCGWIHRDISVERDSDQSSAARPSWQSSIQQSGSVRVGRRVKEAQKGSEQIVK